MQTSNAFPIVTLLLLPVLMAALWCASMISTSWLTGWRCLSRRFANPAEPQEPKRTASGLLTAIYMRYWSHYSGVVRLTATDEALSMSIMILFRVGHPSLCIPWREVQMRKTRAFLKPYVELWLGAEEQIPLRLRPGTARKLGLLNEADELQLPLHVRPKED